MPEVNQYIFELIFGWSHKSFIADDLAIFIAEYLPYLLVLEFLLFAFSKKDWRMKILIFADGALAVILARGIATELIRFFYHNPRPFEALNLHALISESGYSFPSGHAAWFFALAMTIFFYNRRTSFWYFVLAAINGLARVYVGVHWPFDIVSGAIVGILCAMLVHRLVEPSLKAISPPPEEKIVAAT